MAQVDAHKVEATVAKMGVIQKIQVWSQQVLQLGTGQWEVGRGESVAYSRVHSLVTAHFPQLVDGYPFWAVIFYLIRSGCDKEALEYARHYERYLSKTEKRFLDYLASWVTSADHK